MRNMLGGIILITIGALFLLDNLNVADFGEMVSNYWPLILILWGFSILTGPKKRSQHGGGAPAAGNVEYSSDLIHDSNVFGDVDRSISSNNFKGGSISTVFGDCVIDLTKASLADGRHELKIHGVFGDTSVIVPKQMAAVVNANSTFGSVTVFDQHKAGFSSGMNGTTPDFESSAGKLTITISRVFGDIRVS